MCARRGAGKFKEEQSMSFSDSYMEEKQSFNILTRGLGSNGPEDNRR